MHLIWISKFLILFSALLTTNAWANIRMGIISDSKYCGERELAWRIKIAAESLGWTVFLDEKKGVIIRNIKSLDWVICVIPNNPCLSHHCPNYVTIFHPFNFLDQQRNLVPFYERYDGYLLTVNDKDSIAASLKQKNRQLYYIPFYPSVQDVPYKEVELNEIVTMIPVWSNRLTDLKFKNLYNSLSRTGYVKFYGIQKNENLIEDGYMGQVPFDGISLINILQKHGIVLVFHSDIHNQEGIPTSRIFEAAAASAVIISDENAFVKKHFGEAVFYIDTSLSAEEIYRQIEKHMDTIRTHPEKALEMAKRAHQILTDHFLMTTQLMNLEELHQKIKQLEVQ